MNINKRIKDIKRQIALDECFDNGFFDICPINELHGLKPFPNKKILSIAHCVRLDHMQDDVVNELKSLAREAIYYEKPWWKIF